MNGHAESEEPEEAIEDANRTLTPHVNEFRKPATADEAQSESLYPDSTSSDRGQIVAPRLNEHVLGKINGQVTIPAMPDTISPKLSNNQKKKEARKMSIHQTD